MREIKTTVVPTVQYLRLTSPNGRFLVPTRFSSQNKEQKVLVVVIFCGNPSYRNNVGTYDIEGFLMAAKKVAIAAFVTFTAAAGASVVLMPHYSEMGKLRREAVRNKELSSAGLAQTPGSVRSNMNKRAAALPTPPANN